MCIGRVSCELAQAGKRASGEGTGAVRKVAKSRLSKQKTLRKQYAGKMVRPGKAKIKGKTRKMCERTLFLAKT